MAITVSMGFRRGSVHDQRRGNRAQDMLRGGRQCQRAWTNVSLNPSGSVIMNTRLPHGMSCGS